MATKAGIPLASYDDLILGAKQAGYIGRDPKDGGAAAAKAVVAKVPKGNYVLIGGDAGQTGSTLMQQGYHTVLDPLVAKGDIKIVMDQFTPAWKTEPAQANAENALTANGNKVDAFLVSYDGMSLGVLQAIKAAGIKPGSIPGHRPGHGARSAAQAIVEGRQFGSLWPAPDEMAIAGAKAAVAMAQCQGHWRDHHRRQRRRPNSLGQDADLPRQPERNGRLRLQAPLLAQHRRGLQERSRQEADLQVSKRGCRSSVDAPDGGEPHARPVGKTPTGTSARLTVIAGQPDQVLSRRARPRRRLRLDHGRARSSRSSGRTARANRRSSRSWPASTRPAATRARSSWTGRPTVRPTPPRRSGRASRSFRRRSTSSRR